MSAGTVVAIHRADEHGGAPQPVSAARALRDGGLDGDRYVAPEPEESGWDFSTITLIERAAEEAAGLPPGASRRNVSVDGIALNDLVGRRFRVGTALCEGVELCHPCAGLEAHLGRPGLVRLLVNRGGIRARVLEEGEIRVGDAVAPLP